ncbi:MAG: hypothetical protein JWO36_5862, partial [Myxococcales bacterium]|nr:hypothetical protein [Myxococcales bacterium]
MTTKKKPAKKVAALLQQSPGAHAASTVGDVDVPALVRNLGAMIDAARKHVSVTANAVLTALYWQIGHRVRTDVPEGRRAEYGAQIVAAVSRQLEAQYGRGFNEKSLRRMVQFASAFSDAKIVATLSRHLGWSHFVELIPLKHVLARDFYVEMCRVEHWSVRQLRERIDSMLYERTALSKKPDTLIRQ